jgi:hypothetical protein
VIPLLRPPVLFGRSGLNARPVNHFAFSTFVVEGGYQPNFFSSDDGLEFSRRRARGDYSRFTAYGAGKSGVFWPICSLQHEGKIYLGGRIIDDGSNARAAVLVAFDDENPVWELQQTGLEGPKGAGYRGCVGLAVSGGLVCALSSTGERAVFDGAEWSSLPNLGFTGNDSSQRATCLIGGPAGFAAGGVSGQLFVAADPMGAWTPQNSQFGSETVVDGCYESGVYVIIGRGKISSASVLSNWVARAVPAALGIPDVIMHAPGRFFVGGFNSVWITSGDAANWLVPADTPFKSAAGRARSGYKLGNRWFVHWNDGLLSYSDDDASWTRAAETGLNAENYVVSFGRA